MFVQDDWKVTPRLTVNLGIRYEWESVPAGEKNQNRNSISNLPGPWPHSTTGPFGPYLRNAKKRHEQLGSPAGLCL